MPVSVCSTIGVEALIKNSCAQFEAALLAQSFSSLFPEISPWASLTDIPEPVTQREAPRLKAIAEALTQYQFGLTETAGQLAPYLDVSEEDIRELALSYAQYHLPRFGKIRWTERFLGASVPGKTPDQQLARVNDARFWRRAIRTRLLREREHFFLRMRLIGKSGEAYVSDKQLLTRMAQLRRQEKWMKETVLVPRYILPGEQEMPVLTLEQVASSPKARFAKLYTFVHAMDELAQEAGLWSAMLTLTLEPEWHPNPSYGNNSWNGANPREAHRSLCYRWQSILRDLHRLGVGISGLRVVECHQDGCPHWHIWLLYRPEAETTILATVMKYFPNKLKVRTPRRKNKGKGKSKGKSRTKGKRQGKRQAKTKTKTTAKTKSKTKSKQDKLSDCIYETREDLLAGVARPLSYANEGAQLELSRIDRSISNGASYVMKYLLKTVDAGENLGKQVGLFPEGEDEKQAVAKQKEHPETARRVDAYRSLWGINSGQLFGVAKCLTAWDELRRLTTAPAHPELKHLWVLARGSDKEGRIRAGAEQRGDAKGFLQALGGLAASGKPAKGVTRRSIGRLTETAVNSYGETIVKTKGVTLVEHSRVKVDKLGKVNLVTGECKVRKVWRSVKTVVAEVKTRLTEWLLVPKAKIAVAMAQAKARCTALVTDSPPA